MEYLIILFLLIIICFFYEYSGKPISKNSGIPVYCLSCIILVLFAGLRYRVGVDTLNYIALHDYMPEWREILNPENVLLNREFGWIVLSSIAKILGDDFIYVQLIVAFIVNISVFYFMYKYAILKFTAILIYFVVFYPYLNFEIMRESVAISIFLVLGIKYIKNKQWVKYVLIVFLCVAFHTSAIFLLLIPILKSAVRALHKSNFLVFNTILFFISLILAPIFIKYLLSLPFGNIIAHKLEFYSEYEFSLLGNISAYIVYVLFPLVLSFFVSSKGYNNKEMLIVYSMVGTLVALFSIFFRLLNYLTPFLILALAEVIYRVLINKDNAYRFGKAVLFILFILIFFNYKLFIPAEKGYPIRWYAHWFPYYSVFNQQIDPDREFINNL
ncbi:EpsG family protein [Arcticibacterium luteifluviistationis]|uniref:EpsG family protein n=1 Tax=Arcticibacterium luteifluviistationis TaxID=1784714 RepID=UPI0013A69648|nr:EpsG family protein [Arcticibacterium luteifluviistationis]